MPDLQVYFKNYLANTADTNRNFQDVKFAAEKAHNQLKGNNVPYWRAAQVAASLTTRNLPRDKLALETIKILDVTNHNPKQKEIEVHSQRPKAQFTSPKNHDIEVHSHRPNNYFESHSHLDNQVYSHRPREHPEPKHIEVHSNRPRPYCHEKPRARREVDVYRNPENNRNHVPASQQITKDDLKNFTKAIEKKVTEELEHKIGKCDKKYNRYIIAKEFKVVPIDETCKEHYYDATWDVVNNNFHKVKHAFDHSTYFVARVMNGSVDGPGYGYNTRTFDERNIAAKLIYEPKDVRYEKKEESCEKPKKEKSVEKPKKKEEKKKDKSKDKKKKDKKKNKKNPGIYEEKQKFTSCGGGEAKVKTTWEPFLTQKYHKTSTGLPVVFDNHQEHCLTPNLPHYASTSFIQPYITPSYVSPYQSMGYMNLPVTTMSPAAYNVDPQMHSAYNAMYQTIPQTNQKPMFFNTPSTQVSFL